MAQLRSVSDSFSTGTGLEAMAIQNSEDLQLLLQNLSRCEVQLLMDGPELQSFHTHGQNGLSFLACELTYYFVSAELALKATRTPQ